MAASSPFYTPKVSMLFECPITVFTKPSGNFFAMETKVCRSSYGVTTVMLLYSQQLRSMSVQWLSAVRRKI